MHLFLLSSHLVSHLYFHPPSRLDHQHKTTMNESLSIPLLQPPAFPFPSYLFFSFLYTLGNDNQFSATAAWHSYTPEHSSIDFSSFLLTFSSTIFLNVQHNDYTFTYPSLTLILLPTNTITKV